MNLQDSMGFLINKLAHKMATGLDSRLKEHGVTISQWTILAVLWKHEGIAQVEIQQHLAIEGSTVTGIIQRMIREGLIQRKVDPEDRRVQRVYLTDKGRALEEKLVIEAMTVNQQALQGLSEDEQAFFMRLLKRSLSNF